jgi:hypothetical protein
VNQQRDGTPLAGGRMTSGIVRHGDRVRRPAGPWTPAVHVKYWPIDASGAADSLEFLARELRWIHRLTPDLARAL